MLITICNLSYYNLYHIIMCFVKINHQSINQSINNTYFSVVFTLSKKINCNLLKLKV